jgi:hypothetical protein
MVDGNNTSVHVIDKTYWKDEMRGNKKIWFTAKKISSCKQKKIEFSTKYTQWDEKGCKHKHPS